MKTVSTHKKWLPKHNAWVHFTPRSQMRKRAGLRKAVLPVAGQVAPPATTLMPVWASTVKET